LQGRCFLMDIRSMKPEYLYGFLGGIVALLILIFVRLGIISDRLKESFPTEDDLEEEALEIEREALK